MSNKGSFLLNYEKSRNETQEILTSLKNLTATDEEQCEKIHQLEEFVKDRFQLLEKAISVYKGETRDKEGLLPRAIKAKQIRGKIGTTAKSLTQSLEASLYQRKQDSHKLIKYNQFATQLAIILGGILAGLVGVIVVKDVKERERTENQLRLLNTQKSQFFSIISHDLRGPTRNTALLLEMMEDPAFASSAEEAKKIAGAALQSARQTQKLVEDLLNWGRIQMDQVGLSITRFRPYEPTEKVVQALQSAALLKNISLENCIPRNLWIQADINMVETVIRNLVSNAIKFTPDSGNVRILARPTGQFVELAVEDSGVGIPPEAIKKIFSFHTKHTTKGTSGELGSGLGLAVCREFVERNGGTIAVESQVGQGSKFNVRLPAAQLMEQD